MISSKEKQVYDAMKEKYNSQNNPNMKYKKDGTLDMRYRENMKLFGEEYKKIMLRENRKYNHVCNDHCESYRKDILEMTEEEIVEVYNKIEITRH
jgi:hypothetical protein